ncbi:MAG: hypothetical protein H6977_14715 [Gammaproteobacteria bacterium]|nr:hypothetical protein [Gammaproteobacteria bacterium]MCP5201261.1 hypothetical protein [Gammaproteobacteria bacterium]
MNTEDLKVADILLSTGEAKQSKAIRIGTGSPYSHAALYVGDGYIVEAIGIGVVRQSLERAMSDDVLVAVYRRINMSAAQAGQVVRYVKRQVGKDYDAAGAIGAGVTSPRGFIISVFAGSLIPLAGPTLVGSALSADVMNRLNPEKKFFCSELVALAFEHAGVPLVSGGASATPADLSSAHVLNHVGTLKEPASKDGR